MPLVRRTTIATPTGDIVVEYRGGGFVSGTNRPIERCETPLKPDRNLAAELLELAARVRRLTISRRDPERFFEDRSEIAEAIKRLARA